MQVLVQRGQCSGLVLVQAQGVFEGDDQALPFTGRREGQRGDEGEAPGDLPAADAGEQALVFQVDACVDECRCGAPTYPSPRDLAATRASMDLDTAIEQNLLNRYLGV